MSSRDLESIIALGGAIPFLIAFLIVNRKIFNLKGKIGLSSVIYIISVITGGISGGWFSLGGFESALVAGFWAPLFYTIFITVLFRNTPKNFLTVFRKDKFDWIHNDSDLIDGFNFEDEE